MEMTVQQGLGGFPYFSFMIATLIIVSLVLFIVPKLHSFAKQIALVTSIVTIIQVVFALIDFDFSKPNVYQLTESYSWIPQLGVTWSMGTNAFSLIMILGASIIVTLSLISGWKDNEHIFALENNSLLGSKKAKKNSDLLVENFMQTTKDEKNYVALVLLLEAFIITIFTTTDLFVFYLAFEAMLIPAYFMISRFGIGIDKSKAAMKFLLYSLFGGLVMLLGIVTIFVNLPPEENAFRMDVLPTILDLPFHLEIFVFLSFFIAFAIKAPMVPLHTWLTSTVENARPSTSAILVGILDKIGTFGMLSFTLVLFPNAVNYLGIYIIIWAIISVFYAGLLAIWEKNLLRLISLTSVSHFGFIILGIYVGSDLALSGAMLYMVAHMVSIAGLFFATDYLGKRTETFDILSMKGMSQKIPVLAGCFLIFGLATIALPGLSGFVPEYLVLLGTFRVLPIAAGISVLAVVISAVYILLPYQQIFAGKYENNNEIFDMSLREKVVSGILVIFIFILGLFPNLLLNSFSKIASEKVISFTHVKENKVNANSVLDFQLSTLDNNEINIGGKK